MGFDSVLQKKNTDDINNKLQLVMKSGKYTLGYKIVLKTLRSSKGMNRISVLTQIVYASLIRCGGW
jgi:ribosomal protein L30E